MKYITTAAVWPAGSPNPPDPDMPPQAISLISASTASYQAPRIRGTYHDGNPAEWPWCIQYTWTWEMP
jgi:hypothetical protein